MHTHESPQAPAGNPPRKFRGTKTTFAAAGLIVAGALALSSGGMLVPGGTALAKSELLQSTAATQTATAPRRPADARLFSFADIVERVAPAVVTVQVDTQRSMQPAAMQMPDLPAPFRDFFRQFEDGRSPNGPQFEFRGPNGRNFGMPAPRSFRSQAAGSGFIIDPAGYIVTNNHVVESARRITVKMSDGREFEAKLVGADRDTDVALLKVEASNLPTVPLGDERGLRVGDWVVAVGNPFGLGGTVTAGIVSSLGRDIGNGPYTDYIQIDAPINRGNSGGPTFDISGKVIGMNTVIYSPSGGSVGIGFAVPATTIKAVVDELRTNGSISRGWLGVQVQDFTADMAASLGMRDQKGAMVADVVDGSPAARAGFEQGDVVVAVNGTEIADSRALTRQVAAIRAGDNATFTVMRNGERRTLSARIERRDADRMASAGETPSAQTGPLGLSLMPINPAIRQQYELDANVTGVLVGEVDPNSEAARKGLAAGDVIKRVGSQTVRQPSDVVKAVQDARQAGRDSVLMLVANEQGDRFVALRLAQG